MRCSRRWLPRATRARGTPGIAARAPAGAAVAWDHFLGAVVGYNRRFAFGEAREDETEHAYARVQESRSAPVTSARIDREMPEADARGMVAYLEVLTNCLGGGEQKVSPVEARDRVAWLSQRCAEVQGPPGSFLDALMRLHANPVPSRLKAACRGAGAASATARRARRRRGRAGSRRDLQTNANTFGVDFGTFETRGVRRRRRVGVVRRRRVARNRRLFGFFRAARTGNGNRFPENAFDGRDAGTAPPPRDSGWRTSAPRARARSAPPSSGTSRRSRRGPGVRVRALARARACTPRTRTCGWCPDRARGRPARRPVRAPRARARNSRLSATAAGELRRRRHRSQEERWWLARTR